MADPKEVLVAFLRKQRDDGHTVGSAAKLARPNRRISTGSFALDLALGGGLRLGGAALLWGEKSGGKTTTALRTLGIAQGYCRNCCRAARELEAIPPSDDQDDRWSATAQCDCYATEIYRPEDPPKQSGETPKQHRGRVAEWKEAMRQNSYEELVCAWIDSENQFDPIWARSLGADTNRLVFHRPVNSEEGIDVTVGLLATAQVDFIVVDSIASLAPSKELEGQAGDWQQALAARLWNKATRKLISGTADVANKTGRSVTQIWLNQVRMQIGKTFGDPSIKPGGRGQDFGVDAEIQFLRGKAEAVAEQFGNKDEVRYKLVSETFRFRVGKNRTGASRGTEWEYKQASQDDHGVRAGTVLEHEYVFKLALHYLVKHDEKKGAYKLADRVFDGQKQLLVAMREEKEFFEATRLVLLDLLVNRPSVD